MTENYKLTYFTLTGLGEPIRFVFAYRGINYEDIRIKYEDWETYKSMTPFGRLPNLEVDGVNVCQSVAITRYLGKKYGLGGANEWEDLQIDVAIDTLGDLVQEFSNAVREQEEEKRAKKIEILENETWQFYLEKFDSLIKQNGGHLATKNLSWGDLYFVAVMNFLCTRPSVSLDISDYPNAVALNEKIHNIPNIKAWVAKRPEDNWIC